MNEGVWKSFGFDYAQPPGFENYVRRPSVSAQSLDFVNYVRRPLVCAQSLGRKTIFFSPP